MVRLLEDMAEPDHAAQPVLVLANDPTAGGLAKAEAQGIATSVVDHRDFKGDRAGFEAAIDQVLREANVDIVCLAGFMRILGEEFVGGWEGRMLNIHPSLLPKYKGLHTHQRALDAGDTEHGCSVHLVTPALDDGPILGQTTVLVKEGDTADSLAARVLKEEHQLYPKVLRKFAASLKAE